MTGAALIDFCIGLIVLLVVVFLIYKAIEFLAPGPEFATIAKYVVGALAIIVLLLLAKAAIFGGGGVNFWRHSSLVSPHVSCGPVCPSDKFKGRSI